MIFYNLMIHRIGTSRPFRDRVMRYAPHQSDSYVTVCICFILFWGRSVGAARKVSPNWSQETMTCHSFNCFSIVWGQG